MPVIENTKDILADLRRLNPQNGPEGGTGQRGINLDFNSARPKRDVTSKTIRFSDFDVNPNAIYDRLSDGSYIAKYENYLGEAGNEDRLAQLQSGGDKWSHGIQKFQYKTLGYAWDSVVGTAYGIGKALFSGDSTYVWDNDFADGMDDYNKRLDNELPNYYTDEEKSMGFLESMGTANFWANDFLGGLAFVGGAILPDLVIAGLTGGASAPGSIAKHTAKFGAKALLKKGGKKLAKESAEKILDGKKFLGQINRAQFAKGAGDLASTGAFLVRTSNFEAGMEARHNFHEAMDGFYRNFEGENGRQPTLDETSQFTQKAITAGNYVYGANMAILSVSNAIMFGKTFNIGQQTGKRLTNAGNRLIGLGVKKTAGKEVVKQIAKKRTKVLGNAYFILGKPAVEGLYEEGLQGVAGKTMQSYLEAQYSPDNEDVLGTWAHLSEAFHEQYTTKEGWKEIGLGMMIGSVGGGLQGQAPAGLGKGSYSAANKRIDAEVTAANTGTGDLLTRIKHATAQSHLGKLIDSGAKEFKSTDIENSMMNVQYIKSQEDIRSHREIRKDFEAVVGNMEFTDEQIEDLGGLDGVVQYGEAIVEEFNENLKNYKFAKKAVTALGLDKGVKISKGNQYEIADALTMNIVNGKTAMRSAQNVASQIDTLVGEGGSFDLMEHFNNLDSKQKSRVEELRTKRKELESLKIQANNVQQLAGLQVKGTSNLNGSNTQSAKVKRYEDASERLVKTNERVGELEQEVTAISKELEVDLRAANFTIGQEATTESNQSILESLDRLDKISQFTESLKRTGRTADAETLDSLLESFKEHSDAHREMVTGFQRMIGTGFFSSREGKGLRKFILGEKYVMSDDFRNIIKENDELLDNALEQVGRRGTGTILEVIEDKFENEDLSEREKFRLESIIRLQLGYDRVANKLETIQEESILINSEPSVSKNWQEGDTVSLKEKINPEGKDLTTLSVINDILKQVGTENDIVRELNENAESVTLAKERLAIEKAVEIEEGITKEEQKVIKSVTKRRLAGKIVEPTTQILQLETNFPNAFSRPLAVKKAEDDLKAAQGKSSTKILKSEDYKRMNVLIKKDTLIGRKLTEAERKELEDISASLNQWTQLTGTVIEGLRISDLVHQKIVLESTPIAPVNTVAKITASETLSQINIADNSRSAKYTYGQTYHAVTAIKNKEGHVVVSGISTEQLLSDIGLDIAVTSDAQGNTIIQDEDGSILENINANSPITILATNENLPSNYSIVLKTETLSEGETRTGALLTDFHSDFGTQMNPDAIYDRETGDGLTLEISEEDGWNREIIEEDGSFKDGYIDAYRKVRNNPKKLKALQAEMSRNMLIRVKDAEGNFIAVLKANRGSDVNSIDAAKFEAMRNNIATNIELLDELADVTEVDHEVEVPGLKIKKILLGHPNFNFSPDGSEIESKQITKDELSKVKDIGFIEAGKMTTRSGQKGIDTTFINSQTRDNTKTKHPFIVIEKGAQRIAYPVTVSPLEGTDHSEFQAIYEADRTGTEIATSLNTYMAENGIDIKLPGKSFATYGKSNLTDTFFAERLAELESIEYFHDFETWTSKDFTIENIVDNGMSVDIDLSNPLHSPKIQMDLSEVNVTISEVTQSEEAQGNIKKKTAGKGLTDLTDFIKKDC